MLTELLRTAEWVEDRVLRSDLRHPPAVAIAQAVRDLDGRTRTTVLLRNPGGAEMLIAADREDRYLVHTRTASGEYLAPAGDPSLNGETTRVRVFEEEVDFPVRRTMGADLAVEAALRFAFDGSLDPELSWERSGGGRRRPGAGREPPA